MRRLLLLLTLALTASLLLGTGAEAARPGTVTFRAHPLPRSVDVANSLRGQYDWLEGTAQPGSIVAPDTYYRDDVRWGAIEPARGSYDFTLFDRGLAAAASKGGRFGFRVMAWCPGCPTEAMPDKAHTTPAWLPTQGTTGIPDWNSPIFLGAWQELMATLGARYGNDPRLGWVDVGGYGKFGEWHVDDEGTPASAATMRTIIAAVVTNFPHAHVVINAMDRTGTAIAMSMSRRIGLRADCLGAPDMYSLIATSPSMQRRWRTAPVLSEWCGASTTSTRLGARQVRRYHVSNVSSGNFPLPYAAMSASQQTGWLAATRNAGFRYQLRSLTLPRAVHPGRRFVVRTTFANTGSAPTYDAWRLQLRLSDATGRTVASVPLRGNLRRLLTGVHTFRSGAVLRLPAGTYRAAVAVVDPRGYLAPMALADRGRQSDGSYRSGRILVH